MIQGTEQQDVLLTPGSNPRWRRYALLTGIAGALIAASYQLLVASPLHATLVLPVEQVQIATVQRGSFVRDLAVQGKVVAANAPTLVAQQEGLVQYLKQPGEAVTLGELLAVISSPSLESEVKQQQALLASMQSEHQRAKLVAREQQLDMQQIENSALVNLQTAKRELKRAEQSLQLGVLRQIDLDTAQDALQQAELEFRHAKAKVALAADKLTFEQQAGGQALARQQLVVQELQRRLAALQITAPVTGQVGNWLVPQQSQVLQGQGVLTVIDFSEFEAELTVPESYAAELSAGLAAELTLNGQTLQGQLSHIAAEVKDAAVSARVRFAKQDTKALRQNQRLSGRIVFEQRDNVLKVSRGEFVASGGGRIGYRVADGLALKTPLQVGALSVQWVELLDGVKEGDQLVISNLAEFNDAAAVRLN